MDIHVIKYPHMKPCPLYLCNSKIIVDAMMVGGDKIIFAYSGEGSIHAD